MIKIKREIVDVFYVLSLIHNIITMNKYIYLFFNKYGYDSVENIIEISHRYIYLKLTYIFVSQFQYSFVSMIMLYLKYILNNQEIFIKISKLYCLIKKIGQIMYGSILTELFLKTSTHNPLRYELINLYSYIGNGLLLFYCSLYYQNKDYPINIGYIYFIFPLLINYCYEKNNDLTIILITLIFNTIIIYNIEKKIILYINKLTDKVNYISNNLINLIEIEIKNDEYKINKDFFELTNNKIVILNILYLCFDMIKQHLLYVLVYYYLIDK